MEHDNVSDHLIILLHGGPCFPDYMPTLSKLLPRRLLTRSYTQRGSVETLVSLDQLSVDHHVSDLRLVIAEAKDQKGIGDEQVTLVGHSWGASLALLYAAKFPGELKQVVLLGPAPLTLEISDLFEKELFARLSHSDHERVLHLEKQMRAELDANRRHELNDLASQRLHLLTPSYHHDSSVDQKLPRITIDFLSFLASQESLWSMVESGELNRLLGEITVPVVCIHGEEDPIPVLETFKFFGAALKHFIGYSLPKCGHFPWLEPAAQDLCLPLLVKLLHEGVDDTARH